MSLPRPNSLTSENVLVVAYSRHGRVLAGEGVIVRRASDRRRVPEGTRFTPRSHWVATGRDPQRVQVNISWEDDQKVEV